VKENLEDLIQGALTREIRNIEKKNIQRIVVNLYNVSGMAPEKIDQIMKTVSPEVKDAFDEFRIRLIEQGREEGIEQGREEGIEQGREEGIEQDLKKIALNMITRGYSDEQIVEITNLSIKRIHQLRKECSG
jgi:predicted transposase/invertase (TIGR01784 family)